MSDGLQRLQEWRGETAIVLGSGLNSLVEDATDDKKIPYSEFKEIPKPSVPGHAGQFVLGKIDSKNVIFAQGRVHLYEGFSALDVTACVRVLAQAGIKQLILTNAAGSANPDFKPGSWMMITDHINLTGTSPLIASVVAAAVSGGRPQARFIDMTGAYSLRLRENFRRAANKIDMKLHEGIYAGLLGPQYETPAEVKMLRSLGVDAVGMSTVPETIQARALGLEVAGFSCLTNLAAGLTKEKLSHEEVLEVGKKAAADFTKLLQTAFKK
jgi:purine-nucleoside phosphorylase